MNVSSLLTVVILGSSPHTGDACPIGFDAVIDLDTGASECVQQACPDGSDAVIDLDTGASACELPAPVVPEPAPTEAPAAVAAEAGSPSAQPTASTVPTTFVSLDRLSGRGQTDFRASVPVSLAWVFALRAEVYRDWAWQVGDGALGAYLQVPLVVSSKPAAMVDVDIGGWYLLPWWRFETAFRAGLSLPTLGLAIGNPLDVVFNDMVTGGAGFLSVLGSAGDMVTGLPGVYLRLGTSSRTHYGDWRFQLDLGSDLPLGGAPMTVPTLLRASAGAGLAWDKRLVTLELVNVVALNGNGSDTRFHLATLGIRFAGGTSFSIGVPLNAISRRTFVGLINFGGGVAVGP